ncbi:hypothetical protein [Streptomyces sp. NPDC056938]|uniref:hypothetical protein n=1 Tax=unclassified Streptomyces TaxID=2593676 RepID=UPI00362F124C
MTTTEALEAAEVQALFNLEVLEIQRQSKDLREALRRDSGNPRLKARIACLDALLLALCGDLSALAERPSVLAQGGMPDAPADQTVDTVND